MSALGACIMSLLIIQLCFADEAVDANELDSEAGENYFPLEDYDNLMTNEEKRAGLRPIPFPCNGFDHIPRCLHSGKGPRKTMTKSGRFCVCLCPNKWVGPECGYAADSLGKRGFPWKIMPDEEEEKRGFLWKMNGLTNEEKRGFLWKMNGLQEDKRGFPWKLIPDGKRNFPWKIMGGKRAFPWKLMGDHKEE